MKIRVFALVLMIAAAGCATAGSAGSASVRAPLGQQFRLLRGQTAAIVGEPLTVRFLRVTEESRCAVGVQCIREGDAKVEVELRLSAREVEQVILHVNTEPRRASFGDYDVHLDALDPQPRTDVPRPRYLPTLRVTKR